MTIMSLILIIAVIVAIVWLLRYVNVPAPWQWVIPTIVVLLLIFFLFNMIGAGHGISLNTPIR